LRAGGGGFSPQPPVTATNDPDPNGVAVGMCMTSGDASTLHANALG
jgi:hypothetical protein